MTSSPPSSGLSPAVTLGLNGKENNLFDEEGKPLPVLLDAVNRETLLMNSVHQFSIERR
ncbi:hypothetical protein bcgnr5369_68220 [Bacillus cereus]